MAHVFPMCKELPAAATSSGCAPGDAEEKPTAAFSKHLAGTPGSTRGKKEISVSPCHFCLQHVYKWLISLIPLNLHQGFF